MTLSQENPQSQDFLKPTVMWISLIFSKLVDLILISLDRIHYYQVLDKIHWQMNQGNVCVWCLSYITESSEILYKIDHDLTMIDRDICNDPRPILCQFSIFHALIVHQLQAGRKMTRFWWIVIDLQTSTQNPELVGVRPGKHLILIEIYGVF